MEIKYGYYEFMGNTVEYWGGQFAYDIDAAEEIPAEILTMVGTYLGEEL